VDGERALEDVSAEVIAFLDSIAERRPAYARLSPAEARIAQ
jgi:hypothetical protein